MKSDGGDSGIMAEKFLMYLAKRGNKHRKKRQKENGCQDLSGTDSDSSEGEVSFSTNVFNDISIELKD